MPPCCCDAFVLVWMPRTTFCCKALLRVAACCIPLLSRTSPPPYMVFTRASRSPACILFSRNEGERGRAHVGRGRWQRRPRNDAAGRYVGAYRNFPHCRTHPCPLVPRSSLWGLRVRDTDISDASIYGIYGTGI
jgi:hypothetical protein